MGKYHLLYDDRLETKTRFISFEGEFGRYDFCLIYSDRFFGKTLLLNMLSNRYAIVGEDDLSEEGFLENSFQMGLDEATELKEYLKDLL